MASPLFLLSAHCLLLPKGHWSITGLSSTPETQSLWPLPFHLEWTHLSSVSKMSSLSPFSNSTIPFPSLLVSSYIMEDCSTGIAITFARFNHFFILLSKSCPSPILKILVHLLQVTSDLSFKIFFPILFLYRHNVWYCWLLFLSFDFHLVLFLCQSILYSLLEFHGLFLPGSHT